MNRRLLVLVGPALAVSALSAGPAWALTAPTPSAQPVLKAVEISGEGLEHPIVLFSDRHAQRHNALRAEVDWLANRGAPNPAPVSKNPGPKFVVTLFTGDQATERYDLYPMAEGGPRVFRPADQPDKRKVGEAWFYGRLSMPTSLLGAGIPLAGVTPDAVAGGQAGGLNPGESESPDLRGLLGEWSRFMGLNVAAIIILAAGVFAIAYLIRKKV
jgi:hypothetical protein